MTVPKRDAVTTLGFGRHVVSVSVWVGGAGALSGTRAASPDLPLSFCFKVGSYQVALAFPKAHSIN